MLFAIEVVFMNASVVNIQYALCKSLVIAQKNIMLSLGVRRDLVGKHAGILLWRDIKCECEMEKSYG